MSISFDRDRNRRQRELTNNKIIKGKYRITISLKGIFGFVEHQGEATFGLGFKPVLTRISNNSALIKDIAINNDKIKINTSEWYVSHYNPSIPQQAMLLNKF